MSIAHHAEETAKAREGLGGMIRRVKIRNYKSIKNCDVELGPFTILVGRNGAGKSNFLDAIRLVSEGLRGSSESFWSLAPWVGLMGPRTEAIASEVHVDLALAEGEAASYMIRLVRRGLGLGVISEERLTLGEGGARAHYHCVEGRVVESSIFFMPPSEMDRPYLARASAIPEFRPAYDALASMASYSLSPDAMRRPSMPTGGLILARDGSNLASTFYRVETFSPESKGRIVSYLNAISPEFSDVQYQGFGDDFYSLLVFRRSGPSPDEALSLWTRGVSDGTLRALGILVAVNQLASDGRPIRLVGIEEPETALHPAAAGVLMDALREAATHTQILVTTHSADLLDRFDPEEDHLLAVQMRDGRTEIGPVNPASREAIQEHLFSAGELLRMDQLHPDRLDVARQAGADSPGPIGES